MMFKMDFPYYPCLKTSMTIDHNYIYNDKVQYNRFRINHYKLCSYSIFYNKYLNCIFNVVIKCAIAHILNA